MQLRRQRAPYPIAHAIWRRVRARGDNNFETILNTINIKRWVIYAILLLKYIFSPSPNAPRGWYAECARCDRSTYHSNRKTSRNTHTHTNFKDLKPPRRLVCVCDASVSRRFGMHPVCVSACVYIVFVCALERESVSRARSRSHTKRTRKRSG